MARTPANIKYGVNAKLSPLPLLFLGLQHMLAMASTLVIPALIVNQIHGSHDITMQLVQSTMIAMGIGSILMGLSNRWIGSGYLCPLLCAPTYLLAAFAAVKLGGLPMLYGMTLIGGLFQVFMALVFNKLRKLFPSEVTGIVVLMIGVTLVPSGLMSITGDPSLTSMQLHPDFVITGSICLAVMIGLTVWGKALSRYAIVIAALIGFIIAYFYHIFTPAEMKNFTQVAFVALPNFSGFTHLNFSADLILPFFIAGLTVTLKNVGNLITCQKINDADWVRPDGKNIRRGLFAAGCSNLIAGFAGGAPNSASSSNIGLSIATATTSRYLTIVAGLLYFVCAFFPKIALIFAIMPKPVVGAILFYVTAFMLVAGAQIIISRLIDIRKTFVIGLSLVAGLSVQFAPHFFTQLAPHFQYLIGSPLTVSTLTAILLTLIFRIGISKQATLTIETTAATADSIWKFLQEKGALWGALPVMINRASQALTESIEALRSIKLDDSQIKIVMRFDEYKLRIAIRYQGPPLDLSIEKPTKAQLRRDPTAPCNLAIYLMVNTADHIKATTEKDKQQKIYMEFDQ